jgi:hypothetical protein
LADHGLGQGGGWVVVLFGCQHRGLVSLGFASPREVIVLAVRWYLRYGLSYRDVEELLAERGIEVEQVSLVWLGWSGRPCAGC